MTVHGMTVQQYKTDVLKRHLPNLPWLTIFGPPYVEMFGIDRLLSTPAYEVQQISDRLVQVNVAPDIPDTAQGWADFKGVRDRCKQHLNCNAFFNVAAPRGHLYRVPEFRFPVEMYKTKTLIEGPS